jgi:hypothetical protein
MLTMFSTLNLCAFANIDVDAVCSMGDELLWALALVDEPTLEVERDDNKCSVAVARIAGADTIEASGSSMGGGV